MVDIDLRRVRYLIAGAEVVQPDTLRVFSKRFEPLGLAHGALRVGYGMAECVLMASLSPHDCLLHIDRIDRHKLLNDRHAIPCDREDSLSVISCGEALPGVTISVVNDQGESLPERYLGEIVIASPALFERYLHRPDLTEYALQQDRLHTGDLGYMADGELFVVDRKRDMIIMAGKHIYPEIMEQIALAVLGEAGGRAAAFGVRSLELGVELPVLVCEVRGRVAETDATRLASAIQQQVRNGTDVILADVRLVRRGWLEITTSGKVSRSATREKYIASGYRPEPPGLAILLTANDDPLLLIHALTVLAANILGVADVQPDDNFFDLGADSLTTLRMLLIIEERFGVTVPTEFFHDPTVAHLARLISPETNIRPVQIDVRTQPSSKLIFKSNPCQFRLRNLLVKTGPIIRGRSLMSYGLGVRVQRAWLQQRVIQNRVFGEQSLIFRRCLTDAGMVDVQDRYLMINLMANTWVSWREQALLQSPSACTRWITLTGAEQLKDSLKHGNGLIIVFVHQKFSTVVTKRLLLNNGIAETHVVTGVKPSSEISSKEVRRTQSAYHALDLLRRGGGVFIAGEGRGSTNPVLIPFHGRQLPIPHGFAELALHSKATIAAVFSDMSIDGRITLEFTLLPTPTTQIEAEDLVRHYGMMLVER